MVPFSFRRYSKRASDLEIYSGAFASIDAGDLKGDIVVHRVEGEHIEVVFVPRNLEPGENRHE
jgi:hypothetical protein